MKLVAAIVLLALLGTSGTMVWTFAYTVAQTHGPQWAYAFAGAAVALLLVECLSGPMAMRAAAARRWFRAGLYVAALIVTGATVFSLDLGFSSTVFSDYRAGRADGARTSALAATVKRPSALVMVDLDMLEGQHKGIKASWCGSKSDEVRNACTRWMALRAELVAAESVENGKAPIGDADGRASLLARLTPLAVETWADLLVVLMACALSLGRIAASCAMGEPAHRVPAPEKSRVSPVIRPPVQDPPRTAESPVFREKQPSVPVPAETALETSAETPAGAPPVAQVRAVIQGKPKRPRAGGGNTIGFISQRDLAEAASLSVRKAREGLAALAEQGEIRLHPTRHGTEIEVIG